MKEAVGPRIIVYTDGGSRGNPGPAALGVAIMIPGEAVRTYGKVIGNATNNDAEYAAVVFALKKIKQLIGKIRAKHAEIEVRMDSELVVRQLSGIYKISEERLFRPFIEVWNLRQDFGSIVFHHIPREENRVADGMVNNVLDRKSQSGLFGGDA